jgi:hypothetical protein
MKNEVLPQFPAYSVPGAMSQRSFRGELPRRFGSFLDPAEPT